MERMGKWGNAPAEAGPLTLMMALQIEQYRSHLLYHTELTTRVWLTHLLIFIAEKEGREVMMDWPMVVQAIGRHADVLHESFSGIPEARGAYYLLLVPVVRALGYGSVLQRVHESYGVMKFMRGEEEERQVCWL